MNIVGQIDSHASTIPLHIAYTTDDDYLTYEQLKTLSDALSCWIVDNVPNNECLIVFGHMQKEMVICFLACVKAGKTYIPVDEHVPLERLFKIIQSSKANAILAVSNLKSPELEAMLIKADEENLKIIAESYNGEELNRKHELLPEEIFYAIYTSGSTGEPKGVQISHRNLSSFIEWTIQEFEFTSKDIVLNHAPYSFDLSVMALYPTLVQGGTVRAVSQDLIYSPRKLMKRLAGAKISIWISTPSFLKYCLFNKQFSIGEIRSIQKFVFCGEVLDKKSVIVLLERFSQAIIYNTYGPTEATVAVTSVKITEEIMKRYDYLPIGHCNPNCRIEIVDEEGIRIGNDAKGEIIIYGESVSPGYMNQHPNNDRFFIEHKTRGYYTGDIGYICNDLLFYCGRKDLQVKYKGFRIETEEIVHALTNHPKVISTTVIPTYLDNQCDGFVAFIVVDESFRADELRGYLESVLPHYMIPKEFVVVDDLPVTSNGKVDRQSISAYYQKQHIRN